MVFVTGSDGLIAGLVFDSLDENGRYRVVGGNHRSFDVTKPDESWDCVQGMDAILHLAAPPDDYDWTSQIEVTAKGTLNVLEAAHEANVPTVVIASSGMTMLGYEWDASLPYGLLVKGEVPARWPILNSQTDPPRPDSPYAVCKLFAEQAGRLYSDKYGMQVIVLRFGAVTAQDRPQKQRQFPGWLSQRDCVSAIDKALSAPPSLRYGVFDVMSDNRLRWRDTTPAKDQLGWQPVDSADTYELVSA